MSVTYNYNIINIGTCKMPSSLCYHLGRSEKYESFMYSISVLKGDNKVILINAGFEDDLSNLIELWASIDKNMVVSNPKRTIDELAKFDIKPEDVNAILFTPLTGYAVGALDHFPNAKFYFGKTGWKEFWTPELDQPRNPPEFFMPPNIRKYLSLNLENCVKFIEDEHGEVFPGVRAWYAGGHHMSSMAYLVNTKKGVVGISDGIFKYRNIEKDIPIGLAENIKENHSTFRRLKKEADIIIAPYDPEVFERFPDGKVA